MRRSYYKPRRTTHRYAKLKWSPVFGTNRIISNAVANNTVDFVSNNVIVAAAAQNGVIPPVQKIKHLKVKVSIPPAAGNIGMYSDACALVMFIPEGNNPTQQLLTQHPEWIMGYSNIPFDATSYRTYSISTTLSRNLNSGDRIVVAIMYRNQSGQQGAAVEIFYSFSAVTRTN